MMNRFVLAGIVIVASIASLLHSVPILLALSLPEFAERVILFGVFLVITGASAVCCVVLERLFSWIETRKG